MFTPSFSTSFLAASSLSRSAVLLASLGALVSAKGPPTVSKVDEVVMIIGSSSQSVAFSRIEVT